MLGFLKLLGMAAVVYVGAYLLVAALFAAFTFAEVFFLFTYRG